MTEAARPNDGGRGKISRLKGLTAGLALAGALAGWSLAGFRFGAGVLAGGAVVLFNLMGTEASARRLVATEGPRWPAVLLHFGKLGLVAAAVAALLLTRLVSPYALLLGLAAFPAAAVLELLFFPAGSKGGKEGKL